MKTCWCALPAMTGSTKCCEQCGSGSFNETYKIEEVRFVPMEPLRYTEQEWKDKFKKLKEQVDELISQQKDLDPEFKETVDKFFWELI